MRNPDFMIVGATRSGSTYLMENLISHPQVFMPVPLGNHSTGDLHFFDVSRAEGRKNYARGLEWYRSLFSEATPKQIVGEKTADYFADPQACRLIHETFGTIKIVVLLRDPVLRAYSHFWHERSNLGRFNDFSALIDHGEDVGEARVLTSSFYSDPLLRYQKTFGSNHVHVIILDDLHADPEPELRRLCRFLGINEHFDFPLKKARINRGTSSSTVEWLRKLAAMLRNSVPGVHQRLLDSQLGHLVRDYVGRKRGTRSHAGKIEPTKPAYPPMGMKDCLRLCELYRSDVEQLGCILDRNLLGLWWPEDDQRDIGEQNK